MRIIGSRIILRDEALPTDNEDMFRWWNLEEWQYYDEPDAPIKKLSREDFTKMLEENRARPKSGTGHRWQVDTADGRHIGWVIYYHLDRKASRAFVGICLPEEDTWNKGYGTEAIRTLVDYLFSEMHLDIINLATWDGNLRMIRCAGKCGFKESARMPHRATLSVRGEPLERVEFTMLRSEWENH